MQEKIIGDHQIVSVNLLVRAVKEGRDNAERFCFILGAGASVSSGIPTGTALEYQWMEEMEEGIGLEEIREIAEKLNRNKHMDNDFSEIEAAWEKAKKTEGSLSSEYYFDIYKLRFYPNTRNGYHYLEEKMADKKPGFGYHPLALILAEGSGSNLVITTNFDSLVEDALFLYTNSKPLVINHELLAEFAGDPNMKRPIVAKLHRGIFFDPLNQPEETNELKGTWSDVLASVFQNYTPIVIGYGGGDNSLMHFLEDSNIKMRNGIYWCYYENDGLPNERIQKIVSEKNGYFVRTAGFDATMLALGNALFPNKIGVHEVENYLNNRTSEQIANYVDQYEKLKNSSINKNEEVKTNQSQHEYKKEIEKMVERTTASERERQQSNQMTAWDYWRKGNQEVKEKQYEKAVDSYKQGIQLQPNTVQFYYNMGIAYQSLGNQTQEKKYYEDAIQAFNMAIKQYPSYAAAYYSRAVVYNNMGEREKALNDYNEAIHIQPEYAEAYYNRGIIYYEMGLKDRALAEYETAIELNPEFAYAYINSGIIWKEKGIYDKAIPLLTKAIALDPNDADAYEERMECYYKIGDAQKAESDKEKFEKLKK